MPRLFEAGERWQYGVSTDLAGQLVEAGQRTDARRLSEAARVRAYWAWPTPPSPCRRSRPGRKAAMHARTADGGLAPMPFAPPPPPNPMLGGGGLWSTAGDYLTLLKALLADGVGAGGAILGRLGSAVNHAEGTGNSHFNFCPW